MHVFYLDLEQYPLTRSRRIYEGASVSGEPWRKSGSAELGRESCSIHTCLTSPRTPEPPNPRTHEPSDQILLKLPHQLREHFGEAVKDCLPVVCALQPGEVPCLQIDHHYLLYTFVYNLHVRLCYTSLRYHYFTLMLLKNDVI
jgi:hypothetical protein